VKLIRAVKTVLRESIFGVWACSCAHGHFAEYSTSAVLLKEMVSTKLNLIEIVRVVFEIIAICILEIM
jgi:hypothetical protein